MFLSLILRVFKNHSKISPRFSLNNVIIIVFNVAYITFCATIYISHDEISDDEIYTVMFYYNFF